MTTPIDALERIRDFPHGNSRQAVDEVLAAVNEVAIQAATATGLVAGEAAIRAALNGGRSDG